ncbi:cytochrome C biogenesis protein CcsB [Vibrio navarrensis]|jgi:cytochrome c553|uniref:Cytochrome C biogenesis protein CcsB n=1 Tax=Vibrio navarrensis TaxID=29495 RepID=A0A099LMT6_9VIBR|nr:cytochrome c [Vibrio navarrensis]KGK08984.1 cytochrome C biogenesis protein CcsB [Vibrio navarrensis]KGK20628.1 cytochrome C biogenesis protein CcsB [Vibrio navarrensis]MBE3665285.1 cytochrome C biogenesis protein CcsB [Vibrio navarrensis]MBE4573909.1 cytochrome C biogenesis protein CcsB [Vibrio navarrensis]MBE4582027.1 cytochrome C biogenesis protein CcsB [Vibrio navarrensis]
MKKVAIGLALGLGLMSGSVMAGDIAAGQAKSAICAACHGADGIAVIPGYPHLKGQNEQYLVSSIKAYKNKERTGGLAVVMQAQAAMLSDADIANVAAYYASLK